jgi:hypothetical protein
MNRSQFERKVRSIMGDKLDAISITIWYTKSGKVRMTAIFIHTAEACVVNSVNKPYEDVIKILEEQYK